MKMKVNGNVIEDDVSIDGLVDCKMAHQIKETKGSMLYTGPKIPPEVWKEILSFFKWCYTTYKSECQVRLYVSPTQNTWRAWAFPQEAKTGMTARELDNEDARTQRAELNMNPPDWIYFGTVHHHCAAGAFQSGTDEENEKNQDGLHITVGKMDEKKHDLHARFYRKGLKFTPDLSWFYDVTGALAEVTAWIESCPAKSLKVSPVNILGFKDKDELAKSLMCEPSDVEFPQAWRENIVEIKPIIQVPTSYQGTTHGPANTHTIISSPSLFSPDNEPTWRRAQRAWKEVLFKCVEHEVDASDLEMAMAELSTPNFAPNIIATACRHHKVDPDDIEREMPNDIERALVEERLSQEQERSEMKTPTSPKSNPSNGTTEKSEEGKEKAGGEAPPSGISEHGDGWSHLPIS